LSTVKRGTTAKPVVDFGASIAGKVLGSDARVSLPRPIHRVLRTDQITDPGDKERPKSFHQGFDELKAAMKAYSKIDADGVGNHHSIVVTGSGNGPFEIVAGRRRYAAAKALKLPVRAAVFGALNDEQRQLIQETENSARTDLAPSEIAGKIAEAYNEGQGVTLEKLALAFSLGSSTVSLYLSLAKDKALLAELDRGLSIREARRLRQEHGEEAGQVAASQRQKSGSESHAKAKSGRKAGAEAEPKPVLDARIDEGKKAVLVFDEKRAKARDFEKYHEALSAERERIGKIIKARERRQ
jgi:ParB/RepB/Spo0J family partition protein